MATQENKQPGAAYDYLPSSNSYNAMQELESLRKENFNLKLRIYLLEHNLSKFSPSCDRTVGVDFELQVQKEILDKEKCIENAQIAAQEFEEKYLKVSCELQRVLALQSKSSDDSSLREKIEDLQKDINLKCQEIKELQTHMKESTEPLCEKISELEKSIELRDVEKQELQITIEQVKAEKNDVIKELVEKCHRLQKDKDVITDSGFLTLQDKVKLLEEQLKEKSKECDEKNSNICDLQEVVTECNQTIDFQIEEVKLSNNRQKVAERDLADAEEELQEQVRKANQLQSLIEKKDKEMQTLQVSLGQVRSVLQDEIQQFECKVLEQDEELKEKFKCIDDLQKALKESNQSCDDLKEKLTLSNEQLTRMENDLAQKIQSEVENIDSLHETIIHLESLAESKDIEIQELKSQSGDAQKEIIELRSLVDSKDNEIKESQLQIDEQKEELNRNYFEFEDIVKLKLQKAQESQLQIEEQKEESQLQIEEQKTIWNPNAFIFEDVVKLKLQQGQKSESHVKEDNVLENNLSETSKNLEGVIVSKDKEIQELQEVHKQNDILTKKNNDLHLILREKDTDIEVLQDVHKRNDILTKKNNDLLLIIRGKDTDIEELQDVHEQNDILTKKNNDLLLIIQEKDTEVEELQDLHKQFDILRKKNNDLSLILQEKNTHIEELNEHLKKNQPLVERVKDLETIISSLQNKPLCMTAQSQTDLNWNNVDEELSTLRKKAFDLQLLLEERDEELKHFDLLKEHVEKLAQFMKSMVGDTSDSFEDSYVTSDLLSQMTNYFSETLNLIGLDFKDIPGTELLDSTVLNNFSFVQPSRFVHESTRLPEHCDSTFADITQQGNDILKSDYFLYNKKYAKSAIFDPEEQSLNDQNANYCDDSVLTLSDFSENIDCSFAQTVPNMQFNNLGISDVPQRKPRACWNLSDEFTLRSLNVMKCAKGVTSKDCRLSSDSDVWSEPDRDLSIQRIGIKTAKPMPSPQRRKRRSDSDKQLASVLKGPLFKLGDSRKQILDGTLSPTGVASYLQENTLNTNNTEFENKYLELKKRLEDTEQKYKAEMDYLKSVIANLNEQLMKKDEELEKMGHLPNADSQQDDKSKNSADFTSILNEIVLKVSNMELEDNYLALQRNFTSQVEEMQLCSQETQEKQIEIEHLATEINSLNGQLLEKNKAIKDLGEDFQDEENRKILGFDEVTAKAMAQEIENQKLKKDYEKLFLMFETRLEDFDCKEAEVHSLKFEVQSLKEQLGEKKAAMNNLEVDLQIDAEKCLKYDKESEDARDIDSFVKEMTLQVSNINLEDEYHDLQTNCAKQFEDLQKCLKDIKAKQTEMDSLTSEVQNLKKELVEKKKVIEDLEGQLKNIEEGLTSRNAVDSTSRAVQTSQDTISSAVQVSLDTTSSAVRVSQDAAETTSFAVQTSQDAQLEDEYHNLQTNLDMHTEEWKKCLDDIHSKQGELDSLRFEVHSLNIQLSEQNSEIKELGILIQKAEKNKEQAEKGSQDSRDVASCLEGVVSQVSNVELEDEYHNLRTDFAKQFADLQESLQVIHIKQSKLDALTTEAHDLNMQLQEKNNVITQLEDRLEKSEELKKEEKAIQDDEHDKLKADCAKQSLELPDCFHEIAQKRSELEPLQFDLHGLNEQLLEKSNKITQLEKLLRTLEERQQEQSQQDDRDIDSCVKEMTTEVSITELAQKHRKLELDFNEQSGKLQNCMQDIEAKQSNLVSLVSEVQSLNEELLEKKKIIKTLENDLQNMEKRESQDQAQQDNRDFVMHDNRDSCVKEMTSEVSIVELAEKYSKLELDFNGQSGKLQNCMRDIEAKQSNLVSLTSKVKSLNEELLEKIKLIKTLEDDLRNMKIRENQDQVLQDDRDIDSCVKEMTADVSITELTDKYRKLQLDFNKQSGKLQNCMQDSLVSDVHRLNEELLEKNKLIKTLEDDVQDMKKRENQDQTQLDNRDIDSCVKEMTTEVSITELAQKHHQLQLDFNEQSGKLQEYMQDIEAKQINLVSLVSEVQSLNEELLEKNKMIKTLEDDLQNLENRKNQEFIQSFKEMQNLKLQLQESLETNSKYEELENEHKHLKVTLAQQEVKISGYEENLETDRKNCDKMSFQLLELNEKLVEEITLNKDLDTILQETKLQNEQFKMDLKSAENEQSIKTNEIMSQYELRIADLKNVVENSENEKKSSEENIKALQQVISEHDDVLLEQKKLSVSEQKNSDRLASEVAYLHEELGLKVSELDNVRANAQLLEEELDVAKSELKNITDRCLYSEKNIRRLVNEKDNLEEILSKKESDLNDVDSMCNTLHEELGETREKLQKMKDKCSRFQDDIQNVGEENETLKLKLDQNEALRAGLDFQYKELLDKYALLQLRMEQRLSNVAASELSEEERQFLEDFIRNYNDNERVVVNQYEDLTRRNTYIEDRWISEREQYSRDIAEINATRERLLEDLAQTQSQLNEVTDENMFLKKELSKSHGVMKDKDGAIERLQRQLSNVRHKLSINEENLGREEDIASLRISEKESHGQIKESHGQIKESHQQIKESHGQIKKSHGQIKESHGQIKESHENIKELEDELAQLKDTNIQLRKDNEEKVLAVKKLEEEMRLYPEEAENKISGANENSLQFQKQIDTFQRLVASLENERDNLRQDCNEKHAAVVKMEGALNEYRLVYDNLTKAMESNRDADVNDVMNFLKYKIEEHCDFDQEIEAWPNKLSLLKHKFYKSLWKNSCFLISKSLLIQKMEKEAVEKESRLQSSQNEIHKLKHEIKSMLTVMQELRKKCEEYEIMQENQKQLEISKNAGEENQKQLEISKSADEENHVSDHCNIDDHKKLDEEIFLWKNKFSESKQKYHKMLWRKDFFLCTKHILNKRLQKELMVSLLNNNEFKENLEQQKQMYEKQCNELEEQNNILRTSSGKIIASLEKNIGKLKDTVEEKVKYIQNLIDNDEMKEVKIVELEEELRKSRFAIDEKSLELKHCYDRIDSLDEELKSSCIFIKELENKFNEHQQMSSRKSNRESDTQTDVIGLPSEVITEVGNIIKFLFSDLEVKEKTSIIESLHQKMDMCTKEMQELCNKLEYTRMEKVSLEHQLENASLQHDSLTKESSEQKIHIAELKCQSESLQENCDNLQSFVSDLEEKSSEQLGEISKFKRTIEENEKKISQLERTVEVNFKSAQQIKQNDEKNLKLKSDLSTAESHLKQLTSSLENKVLEFKTLQSSYDDLKISYNDIKNKLNENMNFNTQLLSKSETDSATILKLKLKIEEHVKISIHMEEEAAEKSKAFYETLKNYKEKNFECEDLREKLQENEALLTQNVITIQSLKNEISNSAQRRREVSTNGKLSSEQVPLSEDIESPSLWIKRKSDLQKRILQIQSKIFRDWPTLQDKNSYVVELVTSFCQKYWLKSDASSAESYLQCLQADVALLTFLYQLVKHYLVPMLRLTFTKEHESSSTLAVQEKYLSVLNSYYKKPETFTSSSYVSLLKKGSLQSAPSGSLEKQSSSCDDVAHSQFNSASTSRNQRGKNNLSSKELNFSAPDFMESVNERSKYSSPDLGIESDPNQELLLHDRDAICMSQDSLESQTIYTSEFMNQTHAVGDLKEFELLKKEIEECALEMKLISTRAKEGIKAIRAQGPTKKILEVSTLKAIFDSCRQVESYLFAALKITEGFWFGPYPIDNSKMKVLYDENQILKQKLDLISADQKKTESLLLKSQRESERQRQGLSKQLHETKKVIKQVKKNVENKLGSHR